MSNLSSRLTTLESLASGTGGRELPALIYFTGCTSTDTTPDKHRAFERYKEQWQDDSRYRVLRGINSFTELEQYAERHNLLNRLIAVVFVDKPAEQD